MFVENQQKYIKIPIFVQCCCLGQFCGLLEAQNAPKEAHSGSTVADRNEVQTWNEIELISVTLMHFCFILPF